MEEIGGKQPTSGSHLADAKGFQWYMAGKSIEIDSKIEMWANGTSQGNPLKSTEK